MQNLKERKPLLIKTLVVVLLVLLCCNLPEEFLFWKYCKEQDRDIPPNTEILISACKRPVAIGVPGGEALFVREGRTGRMYLLDLHTGEKRKVPNDPLLLSHGIFLNSEFVWLEGTSGGTSHPGYRPHYILDLTNGKRYELTDLSGWVDQPDPPDYTPYFQSAEQVFIHYGYNRAIALPPNFRQNPEDGVILYKNQLNTETDFENGELLEIIMKDLGVDYEIVDLSLYYADVPSPSGKYFIRYDGIYLSNTNTIFIGHKSGFMGWYFDDSGLVYDKAGRCYISMIGANCIYYILGPVLKLRLPE